MRSLLLRWGPVILWMAGLFWGSSLPSRQPTPRLECLRWDDKLQHGLAYAILCALVWRALSIENALKRSFVALIISSIYGIFDEFHQACVPTRECSLGDWIMDTTGALIVAALLFIKYRRPKEGVAE